MKFRPFTTLTRSLAWSLIASSTLIAAEAPVSWWRDVTPLFKRSCNGCHNPNKLKGEVDTSTFAGLMKPGKHGPNLTPGNPAQSLLITSITGKEPDMPKEGEALSAAEVALITRWIQEGAKDDTPADAYSTRLKEPPPTHCRRSSAPLMCLPTAPGWRWRDITRCF